jgi:hypothetical protein
MDIIEQFLKQWDVVKQAPLTFIPALFAATVIIGTTEYWFFKANMDRKDDLIATLKEQLTAAKEAAIKLTAAAQRPELRLAMSGGNTFLPNMPDIQNPPHWNRIGSLGLEYGRAECGYVMVSCCRSAGRTAGARAAYKNARAIARKRARKQQHIAWLFRAR